MLVGYVIAVYMDEDGGPDELFGPFPRREQALEFQGKIRKPYCGRIAIAGLSSPDGARPPGGLSV